MLRLLPFLHSAVRRWLPLALMPVRVAFVQESTAYESPTLDNDKGVMIHATPQFYVLEARRPPSGAEAQRHFFVCDPQRVVVKLRAERAAMHRTLQNPEGAEYARLLKRVRALRQRATAYALRHRRRLYDGYVACEFALTNPPCILLTIGDDGHVIFPPRLLL